MKTVNDILQAKGAEVLTIDQDVVVLAALQKMADANIGALVVVDGNGAPIGLFTERDYARKVMLKGLSSPETSVKAIMGDRVIYVHPQQTVEECMALMTENRCRHLPVIENGQLLGLVSIGDLIKATISEKEFVITQLTNYIQSS